jgi:hypothetical protein
MQKQRSLLQGRLNGLYYELPVKIQGWETDFQVMKFLCVYFWFFPYRSLREQDFLAISTPSPPR